MALLHQNLYKEDNLTGVDMKEYFTNLIEGLFEAYKVSTGTINLKTDIQNIILDIDTVIPLGLIANELISNSLKHAFVENPENAEMVLSEGGSWGAGDWAPDDKSIIVGKYVSANESYYYTLDLATKKIEQINPSSEKIAYGGAVFSKDGKGIFITSDENSEFQRLRYYDLKTKKFTVLTSDIDWDVESFTLTEQGDKLAFTVNEDGMSKLYMLDTKTMKYSAVPNIPVGQVYGLEFHPDGKKLAMVLNTPQSSGDVSVMDLSNNSLERWTYSEVGGLNTSKFSIPELIHFPSFDQVDGKPRMIPAFITKPKGNGPFPVVIDIHGGPEGQAQPYFNPIVQYYVNEMGIAVIEPNVRCLLYTSDAADERSSVDLGGRRII